jgi:hypothetical protein
MAERHPAWVNNIDAFEARLANGLLVAGHGVGDALGPLRVRTGIRDATGNPGRVTLGTNKVTVAAFQAVIADPAQPGDGAYFVTMDTEKELAIDPPSERDYRMDLVVAEVIDADPGFRVSVYPGQNSTSDAPPKPMVTNPRSLVLAEITLPPTSKNLPVSRNDTRRFTAALGGLVPVWGDANRPVNPPGSMVIYRMDTGMIELNRNGAWTPYRPPRGSVDTWHAPTLLNSWANYGSPFAPAGYTITEDGWVRLRGLVKGGVFDTTPTFKSIFVLPDQPINYRPVTRHVFAVSTPPPATDPKMGRVDVLPTGNVVAIFGTSGYLSLDGISFATY